MAGRVEDAQGSLAERQGPARREPFVDLEDRRLDPFGRAEMLSEAELEPAVRCALSQVGEVHDRHPFEADLVADVVVVEVGRDEGDRQLGQGLRDGADVAETRPRIEEYRPLGARDQIAVVLLGVARLGDREGAGVDGRHGEVVVDPAHLLVFFSGFEQGRRTLEGQAVDQQPVSSQDQQRSSHEQRETDDQCSPHSSSALPTAHSGGAYHAAWLRRQRPERPRHARRLRRQ
jgi:hypothetical protein